VVAFFSGDEVAVAATGDGVALTVDGERVELAADDARDLREAIGEALADSEAFANTVGRRRPDGSYVVARRGADSTGNRVVFDDPDAVAALYDRLPERFGAEDVGAEGYTGSRRHLLVWHLAERPAHDCAVVSRNPLVVEKGADG